MTLTDGHLRVVHQERARGVHTVIDAFFESLSEVQGSDAVGVILSGAGSDGARGIEAIKERGGITFAQDLASARFPSMPDAAVATECIDFVLPPEDIADQLVQIGLHGRTNGGTGTADEDHKTVDAILRLLHNRTGVDFRHYRSGTVNRRILHRMLTHRNATRQDYLNTVRTNPNELDVLYEDILIGVTRFFRDKEAFAYLQNSALPELMDGRDPNSPIRVWVAGCSGGEEAYSLAIVLLEYLEDKVLDNEIQIFATDISEAAITRARAGSYPHSIEQDVSAERLERFFVQEDGGYRVARKVRDLCIFAKHNLVRDPPFSQVDIISCRNVLIYLDSQLQARAMAAFHYGLAPKGLLFLGAAESATAQYFTLLDKRYRLFRPQPGVRRYLDVEMRGPAYSGQSFKPAPAGTLRSTSTSNAIQGDADRAILGELAPPGVVINDRLEVVQFRGDTTGFLQHLTGTASLHLLKLVRPEFLSRLRSAIEQANVIASSVREEGIALRDGDTIRHASVDVIPFRSGVARERFYAILFAEKATRPAQLSLKASETQPLPPSQAGRSTGADTSEQIGLLREELAEAKRYLQDVIEQYEAANEELRAAGEELQSSNEELQSTNEELETTKEEVQSSNEELTTVNEELRHRNVELAKVSGDLFNVFASTQIPIMIVDSAFVIQRFTPSTDRVMKIISTDVGRHVGDIKLRIALDDLEGRIAGTIERLELSQAEVRDDQGRWWSLTIRPYVTIDRKVDGAVLVFADIDAAKKYGERADEIAEGRQKLLLESEEARAEADVANLSKMAFLANMSHDLRTPLNAIAGYADLMELGIHGSLTEDQESDITRIKRAARHLLSLINDILNFVKVESGHLDLQIAALPVTEAMTMLEAVVFPQVKAKGLSFEVTACEGTVMADKEKFQQVLLNLVGNAIKFTGSGGVKICCTRADANVVVEVHDTGQGIPSDQLKRIFEPFTQVNRSLTNVQHEGVGLGLAISRDLARAMGGDIRVESEVGKGSVFSVIMPGGASI